MVLFRLGWGALAWVLVTTLCGVVLTLLPAHVQRLRGLGSQISHSSSLSVANVHGPTNGDSDARFQTFQIRFPSRYVVTPGQLWVWYQSQGGMAPPALVLVAGSQPLAYDSRNRADEDAGANGDWWPRYQRILASGEDCILIWRTDQLSIADARTLVRDDPYTIANIETEQIGVYRIMRRSILDAGSHQEREDALLSLPDSTTSYYLETCNMHSRRDLQEVLRSFAIRDEQLR